MHVKKNIIVKFINRKTKDEVLRNGRLLKRSQVFVNEHLTTTKRQIWRSWPVTYVERTRWQQHHGRGIVRYLIGEPLPCLTFLFLWHRASSHLHVDFKGTILGE